ncbi:MAG: nicotinamide mononucleotide transporter [Muribaculaceae bacterium]|nr:nicotinamide mononucleotide transporter [Muribaculaceae bacterium]
MDWLRFLDITGLVLGLIYLWLEYKANIWLWAVGIIMPIVNSCLLFAKGLYADFGMEFYYVAIAIYGYYCWRWGNKRQNVKDNGQGAKGKELPITNYTRKHIVASVCTWLVLWGGIYWFLNYHTDSTVPILDSFTTALSAVAMWALARKHLEQWLLWLVVDAVSCVLYIYKGIPFRASLYGFYTVIAIFGYLKWRKMMKEETVSFA